MLGAGIAIIESSKLLKLNEVIGKFGNYLKDVPPLGILFIVCLVCQIFTEFSSNVAAANIILPLLAQLCYPLCENIKINPLYLMFPAAISISMSFHTSIGTPANAYVADLINIPKKVIFYCGFGPSIITLLTYWSTFPTYGTFLYKELNNATVT